MDTAHDLRLRLKAYMQPAKNKVEILYTHPQTCEKWESSDILYNAVTLKYTCYIIARRIMRCMHNVKGKILDLLYLENGLERKQK